MMISLLLTAAALAQDCDVASMSKEIVTVGPHEAAPMFVRLAECDPVAANRVAGKVMPGIIGEEDGFKAAVAAINSGAGSEVMTWMSGLQRDEQSRAIRAYGKACEESPAIQTFLVDAERELGDQFWSDRWYRSLTECRTKTITELLGNKVGEGAGDDRSAFFGVVEAYAINAGAGAIPKLTELVRVETDLEMQINLVGAFADAAQAGTLAGLNPTIAEQAADAVRGLSDGLEPKAIDKARLTLQVLVDEKGADSLVNFRFKSLLQDDGTLLYGTVVFENAVCKNGKPAQRYHVAEASDPGQTWPDQLEEKVKGIAELNWELNFAERCKGEGEIKIAVPDEPFPNKEAMRKWFRETIRANSSAEVKKVARVDHDRINL